MTTLFLLLLQHQRQSTKRHNTYKRDWTRATQYSSFQT